MGCIRQRQHMRRIVPEGGAVLLVENSALSFVSRRG